MTINFNDYANDYGDIINRVSSITGEKFEYFIKLRIDLMKAKVNKRVSNNKSLKILDFGCGIGVTEIFLKESFPNAQIFGIDTSEESVKVAKRLQLNNVSFNTLGSSVLPFKDNFFDLIYSNGTFHHIKHENHLITVKQLLRVLKNGGDIFIFENNPYNPLVTKAMRNNPFDKEAKVIYPRYFKSILKYIGFQINAINYYFFYPRHLRFLRLSEKYLWWFPMGAQYFVWGTKGL